MNWSHVAQYKKDAGHRISNNYMLLPETLWSSISRDNPDVWLNWSLIIKTECGCWYGGLTLDSNIWCGSATLPTRCFFEELSPLGLSISEVSWQSESGLRGEWCEENDSSIERLLVEVCAFTGLSTWGASDDGAGVPGSVLLSDSGPLSPVGRAVTPEPGTSERTPLNRCCSSIIFFKYLPWASILSCSCFCTC